MLEEKKALKCSRKLSARFLLLVHDAKKKKKKQASKQEIGLEQFVEFILISCEITINLNELIITRFGRDSSSRNNYGII